MHQPNTCFKKTIVLRTHTDTQIAFLDTPIKGSWLERMVEDIRRLR